MITSKTNPKIKNIIHLQKASERQKQGLIVVEGRRELERAVASGFEIDTLFICPDLAGQHARIQANNTEEVSAEGFEKIAYRGNSDGLLALVLPFYHQLEKLRHKPNPLYIVLESVEKPGNLGAVLRTADAAGVDAVIVCDPRTDIYNPNAIRSSIGCIFSVPVVACPSATCINWLRLNNIQILCTYLQASVNYLHADYTRPTAIVMGTEATGLSDEWVKASDQNIIIPMRGIADSLNVAASTAIVVFEAVRQRG